MKPRSLKLGANVRIHWIDSTGAVGWIPLDANRANLKPEKIITQAFVLENTSESLTVTHTFGQHARTVLSPLTIPWGCIQMLQMFDDDTNYPFPVENPSKVAA